MSTTDAVLEPGARLYTPKPNQGAVKQIAQLTSAGERADADRIAALIETP